jgi:hypothetical protein
VTTKYPTTATLTNVASSTSSTALFAANSGARTRTIHNDSTAILYVKFGATASSTSYTVEMASQDYFEFPQPLFAGAVEGIWAAENGHARVTEVT